MELEVAHEFESEQHFWDELDGTISRQCDTHDLIDNALRSYLGQIACSRGRFIDSEYDFGRCAYKLQCSPLFQKHAEYIRRQFVHCLLQEDDHDILLVAATFLLSDAQINENTFQLLNEEGLFPRLVDLITSPQNGDDHVLHRLLMEVFYEMSRIQKISLNDLAYVEDDFVIQLFNIIEQVSDDVTDPYHYPVIRVLLVLNEQFMVAAHDPSNGSTPTTLTNKVIKALSAHGSRYKTFGENIILLLNREDETSLQLLTLKLMYLIFTTPPTYEYFYTNDLRVLVDILLRNLLDLPEEATSLRHTYLRVLYPLLEHTQLQHPPHYKRDEIQKLLQVLGGGQLQDQEGGTAISHWSHFDEVDETTKRLVKRCQGVTWLFEPEVDPRPRSDSPVEDTEDAQSTASSPISPSKSIPPALPAPRKLRKRNSSKGSTLTIGQYLTPQLPSARQSSLSMMEVATQREKPGIKTPSRNPSLKHELRVAVMTKKEKPPPPKARRSGWVRMKGDKTNVDTIEESQLPAAETEENPEVAVKVEKPQPEDEDSVSVKDGDPEVQPPPSEPTQKKPPPAPKSRKWRMKRSKEETEGSGSSREPGKFNPTLPSIITNSEKIIPISPFSPLEQTLSPTGGRTGEESDPSHPTSSVSEALGQAQAQAVSGITETLEKAHITQPSSAEAAVVITPDLPPPPPPPPPPQITRTVLAPPGQAPPRAVPGPHWEIEKSPFLTDADDEVETDMENDERLERSRVE